MRRLLAAAFVLLALAALFVASRIGGIEPSETVAVKSTAAGSELPTRPVPASGARALRESSWRTPAAPSRRSDSISTSTSAPDGIRILLLDSKGDPMPGIVLYVSWFDEGVQYELEGTTDRAGMLPTDLAAATELEGIVLEDGLLGLYADAPFEAAPDRPQVVVVRVPRSANVTGIVRDEEGRPVPDARVVLESQPVLGLDPFVKILRPTKCEAESGADGKFLLALPESCVEITAEADGFDPSEIALACLSADAPSSVDLLLQGGNREIKVEVRAAGVPIEHPVLVTASRAANSGPAVRAPSDPILRDRVQIDRGGTQVGPSTYSVRISRDGDWTIVVSLAKGFADARVPVAPDDERIVVNLRPPTLVPHGIPVRGTVSMEDGTPLAAEVTILHGPEFDWASIGRSDGTGRFEIEFDPSEAEPVLIVARAAGFGAQGLGPIELTRLPASVDLVLPAEKTISGVVFDPDGVPVAARASIRPSRAIFAPPIPAGTAPMEGFLDAGFDLLGFKEAHPAEDSEEGAFSFRGLADGSYEIWVMAEDRTRRLPPAFAVAGAGARDLRITLGSGLEERVSLEGVILEEGTGRPIPGAYVAAWLARGGVWGSAVSSSSEGGAYALPGCPSDVLTLQVEAVGYASFESEIGPLAPGSHRMNFVLQPARTLRLLVLDPNGLPCPGILVSAADSRGRPIRLADARHAGGVDLVVTDLAGRADLHGLPPAQVTAIVGARTDDDRLVMDAAYQAPDEAQPDPVELRFDLRVPLDGIQRIVLPR